MNRALIIPAVLAFILSCLGACGEPTEAAATIAPERGDISQTVEETGIVVFDESYPVVSAVSARVLTADFKEGDVVAAGQLLYTLDTTAVRDQIAQTEISLEKANEVYRQSVNAAGDLAVKSYAGGIVTRVYCHVGDYVSAGSVIADVVDSETLVLQVPFLPSDTGAISVGGAAEVIVDADGAALSGTVTKVHENAQVSEGRQVGVTVEIEVKNPGALRSGDAARARIGAVASAASGTLKNRTEQSISATQSGQVASLKISEGERVSRGDTVMVIKNDALQNAVNNAAINIKDIQNTLDQLENKLADYELTAPIAGVVIEKSAKEADLASAGTPLAVLADNHSLYINAEVDEMYINDIRVGQRATASVQGNSELTYTGQVLKISDSGSAKNGVTYYTVKVSLDSQDKLMEAMNMDVVITVAESEGALLLPVHAISGSTVRILEGDAIVEREVTVGVRNKQFVEILDGLTEEDRVVVD